MYIFDYLIIENSNDIRSIIGAIGSILAGVVAAYIARKQYNLDIKKYHTYLNFDIKSLVDHNEIAGKRTFDKDEQMVGQYEYLVLLNYGDGYAKNIAITLKHAEYNYGKNPYTKITQTTENISLLGPWATSKIFKGIVGTPSKYNKHDKLEFEYTYTDGIGKIHTGKLSYLIGEDYILIPQNNS